MEQLLLLCAHRTTLQLLCHLPFTKHSWTTALAQVGACVRARAAACCTLLLDTDGQNIYTGEVANNWGQQSSLLITGGARETQDVEFRERSIVMTQRFEDIKILFWYLHYSSVGANSLWMMAAPKWAISLVFVRVSSTYILSQGRGTVENRDWTLSLVLSQPLMNLWHKQDLIYIYIYI